MRMEELVPLPEQPGVYLWRQAEEVIYVGKAKNLKARVTSYFHSGGKSERIAREATSLEYIAVRDEVEALLLEANLIKEYRPRYNVLLKDDKQYPFLKLTHEPFPMLMVVRRVQDDGARYWGPFPESGALRRIQRLIERIFPLRKNSGFPMRKRRYPCLNYSMGRCLAPCVGKADPERYGEVVRQVEDLLDGKVEAVLGRLDLQMREAARAQDFERAAELRDQIEALKAFFGTQQQAYDPSLGNLDFVGLARAGGHACLQIYQMREGKILGRVSRLLSEVEEASDEELLRSFLQEYYLKATPLPPRILLPFPLEESEFLEAYWAAKGLKAHFQVPQRGERRRLLELAQKNSQLALESELRLLERRGDHPGLKALAELLRLSQRPFRIEGFDISNLMGEAVVGSIAVFEGGKPLRAQYRRMRLKGFEAPDDYAAMEQTLYRRFTGSLAQQLPLPDLILIDGGLGQLRAAQRGLERAGLEIPAVALAKREEILILSDGHELRLPLTHPALQLLIYLRDETHRNGLLYNRKLRSAQSLKSLLDGIPGIGARRKAMLLEHFSSLSELREAPIEELARLPGMDLRSARALHEHLQDSSISSSLP